MAETSIHRERIDGYIDRLMRHDRYHDRKDDCRDGGTWTWWGLIRGPVPLIGSWLATCGLSLIDAAWLIENATAGCILFEDALGEVSVAYHTDPALLESAWASVAVESDCAPQREECEAWLCL